MNKKNAHKFLPLVQALADGKTIQYAGANWEDIEELVFSEYDKPKDFRIKPAEPRTFEMWLSTGGCMYPLEAFRTPQPYIERITVREVLDNADKHSKMYP
jgi:hypothetical protein